MTTLLKWPTFNKFAKCSHSVQIKPGLVNISAKKYTFKLLEKLQLFSKKLKLQIFWLVSLMLVLVLLVTFEK